MNNNKFYTLLLCKRVFLYLLIILFSCHSCIKKDEKKIDSLEKYRLQGIEDYRSANFSFHAAYIYPNENIKIWINDQLIFDEIGNGNMTWVFYSFPFQIKKIDICSKWNNQIVFRNEYKDTLQYAKRVLLNLEVPIPKHVDIDSLTFPPNWEELDIDSAFRPLTLTEDTINYIIY
ncbi:hypothetical protein [Dysgonomonas sp. GY617]|uniref:hypothetical protein n=1 Tax=Dysgonomonas sp. GY617 TaxID=2780420 RepID=UPI001883AA2B|nr:hypothetical protein [Dysgonomonas sp. GY617]MBF0575575.1 hypothetical protein [Dysgonomonas sp. GY617]